MNVVVKKENGNRTIRYNVKEVIIEQSGVRYRIIKHKRLQVIVIQEWDDKNQSWLNV